YYWAVNGEAVNAGQTNGASVAHTHEPSAAGDYAVEFAVRYPDGTRVSATTVETIASLGSGGGDGGATDDCPGGVYILGVCADE
ncbi:MAG: hypothetical protein GX601_13795, partial [Anaerolineales bacterium]|nr:hypothetical protein [Anaerolineales bacterium]